MCVWKWNVRDADLYRRFYSLYEGSCFIAENRRQRWWGEESRGEGCIDWNVHSTFHEDNKLSLLTSACPASFPPSSRQSTLLSFIPFSVFLSLCFILSLSPHFWLVFSVSWSLLDLFLLALLFGSCYYLWVTHCQKTKSYTEVNLFVSRCLLQGCELWAIAVGHSLSHACGFIHLLPLLGLCLAFLVAFQLSPCPTIHGKS